MKPAEPSARWAMDQGVYSRHPHFVPVPEWCRITNVFSKQRKIHKQIFPYTGHRYSHSLLFLKVLGPFRSTALPPLGLATRQHRRRISPKSSRETSLGFPLSQTNACWSTSASFLLIRVSTMRGIRQSCKNLVTFFWGCRPLPFLFAIFNLYW